jgi:DNA-binding NtrC family response regulator
MENQTRILIVDDQVNTCKSLQAILKKGGYHSDYTQSAEGFAAYPGQTLRRCHQ